MITVDCHIFRSAFSGERVFLVTLGDRAEHVGAASVNYFLKGDGSALGPDEPPPKGQIKGKIAARVVQHLGDTVFVSLPDGEVVHVKRNQIGQWVSPDVLVQS